MKSATSILFGSFCLAMLTQPADARRFRIFSITSFGERETIDLVYDLPNNEPFFKDGDYFDIGYLNSKRGNAYVFYHGDRYRKLDDHDIAIFTAALGFDPTAKHRAQYAIDHADEIANAKAERAHHDELIATGRMIERRADESNEEYTARRAEFLAKHRSASKQTSSSAEPDGTKSSSLGLGFAAIFLFILIFAGRKLYTGIFRLARTVSGDAARDRQVAATTDHLSFDQRVAQRLGELQTSEHSRRSADTHAEREYYSPPPSSAAPVQRGFGRKTT